MSPNAPSVSKGKFGREHAFTKRINELLMQGGLITRVWDVIHFAPPLITSKEEIDQMVAIADEALSVVEREFAGEITD